jgi:endonuclease/exonuclease/phosphatase family metal-dependent hydrolase
MRLMTYNIRKGLGANGKGDMVAALGDALREQRLDLLLCQEVFHPWEAHGQSDLLALSTGLKSHYHANKHRKVGHHGNAVLSKFPIVAYENRDVSIDGHETRGLLHCVLRLPAHAADLHAICVHLGLKESHRRHQLALLSDIVRDHVPTTAPLIVAGDFNDWAKQAHRILEESAGLREVFVHSNGRSPKTFPAGFPLLSLDRIYVRNVRVHTPLRLPRQPWSRLSDHVPLAAEIGL